MMAYVCTMITKNGWLQMDYMLLPKIWETGMHCLFVNNIDLYLLLIYN